MLCLRSGAPVTASSPPVTCSRPRGRAAGSGTVTRPPDIGGCLYGQPDLLVGPCSDLASPQRKKKKKLRREKRQPEEMDCPPALRAVVRAVSEQPAAAP